jgi:hypothetical protein
MKFRDATPERRAHYDMVASEYKKTHKRKLFNARLIREHNMTADEHDALLESQNGVCAICGGEMIPAPHIDHSHSTGQVRGLLCKCCNWGLGHFRDDPNLLRKAAIYIEKFTT